MHNLMDENVRLLAMSPWIRASGEMRAAEEQKIAQVCFETHLACLYAAYADNFALQTCAVCDSVTLQTGCRQISYSCHALK